MANLFSELKGRDIRRMAASAVLAWVLMPSVGYRPLAAATAQTPQPAGISVAVLPLANTSGDSSQESFVDGMTEEISAALARVPALHVGARASAFKFKGQSPDFRAIGQALGTSHLVEGSVRKVGDRIRIAARLVRADAGAQLWSEDYDSEFAGIFDIQEGMARAIASALDVPLGLQPGDRVVRNRTTHMDAYEQYVRAKPLIRARAQKPFADAAVLLEQVVAKDPDFAPASALLAFDYDLAPLYQQSLRSGDVALARRFVASVVPKAEALARRATELSPRRADAYVAVAYASMVQMRLLQADDQFQRALALDPSDTNALHGYSQLLAAEGRIKDSLAMRRRLQALEPFVINYVADTAEIFWLDGQNDTAVAMLNDFRPGRTSELAQVHAAMGQYHEAASVLREMNAANYLPDLLESAARLLESAPAKVASPQSLPRLGNLGFVYLHVGAPERVLEYYEGNVQAGYFQPISTTWFWHPSYAPVRKMERFKAYLRTIGLADLWRARGWPDMCRPAGAEDFACE